ncbi:MAG: hypothetical protein KJO35_03135 [Gammaproteobacteria bacterium]|nr:hypothetical protein [Gammaproteobacteria bacterium]
MNMTETKFSQAAVLTILLVAVSGCKHAAEAQPPAASLPGKEQVNEAKQNMVALPMNLNRQVIHARNDLAQRLGVAVESVVLSGARQVTWRSGALGCPEPGMNYTDALVPGSVIYLKVDNVIHAYHAKFAGQPFYCPRERVESPAPDSGDDLT